MFMRFWVPYQVPGGVDVVILLFIGFPGAKNHSSPIFRMQNERVTCLHDPKTPLHKCLVGRFDGKRVHRTFFLIRLTPSKVYPFAFSEYVEYSNLKDRYGALDRYVLEGGMAGLSMPIRRCLFPIPV